MTDPGERHDANRDEVTSRHRARYQAFCPWFRGDVIDLGGGTGYGATIIGANARVRSILTIDKQQVPQTYVPQDVAVASMVGVLPGCLDRIASEGADVVCAVEFIEHIGREDQWALLNHAHRMLRPDGYMLISTPAPEETGPNPHNRWHVWEVTRADLVNAVTLAGFDVEASYEVDMGALTDGKATPVAFVVGRKRGD